ncbi:hypothetical protein COCNU_contig69564165G000010 [Cocos nucifera]|nr:hypothetical protein [Cocos nucifera]
MGRGKKCLLGFLGFGKKRYQRGDVEDGARHPRKVRPSDEDQNHWYADPNIDRKAKEFIDKVHRSMDPDA